MRALCLLTIIVLLGLSAKSQLSGNKSIPGDYPDLTSALTDLNNQGPGVGGVTFNILASQIAPIGGYIITATGTSSNPVIFHGNGNSILATGSNADVDGIFKLAGSDYITISNFVMSGDYSVEWGVALLKKNNIAPYDGCSHNNLDNLTITLNKTNIKSVGIYAAHHTTGSTNLLSFTSEAGETNSYNNIDGNTISNVYQGISFSGIQGALYSRVSGSFDTLNNFGYTNGNHISNYGGGAAPAYGIHLKYNSNTQINNNSISWSGVNSADLYGIDVSWGFGDITMKNNTISMSGNVYADTIAAINCLNNLILTSEGIRNNHITNCDINTAAGTFLGINIVVLMVSGWDYIEGNTISDNTITGEGNIYFINTKSGWPDISGNNIHGNTKRGGRGSLFGIYTSGAKIINNQVSSNAIVSNSGTDSNKLYGIYTDFSPKIFNNRIHDLSLTGTAANAISELAGIHAVFVDSLAGNSVNHLYFYNSAGASARITGLYNYYSCTWINNNKVSGLIAATGSESVAYGIWSYGSRNVFNNLIGDLHASEADGDYAVCGLIISSGLSYPATVNVDYNTVMINDTSSGAGFSSSAFAVNAYVGLKLRNNIFINKSAPGINGYSAAYRRSADNLANYDLSSGNNLYYAGNPGPRNLLFYDGTNADQTLNNFKNRVYPRDAKSIREDAPFLSTDGSSNNFLHINSAIPTRIESGGKNISGISNDFDSTARQGNPGYNGTGLAPDIGADEFEGQVRVLIDVGADTLSYPRYGCNVGLWTSMPVVITVRNYGVTDINFAERPLTITALVTGTTTQTLTTTINNGYLAYDTSADFLLGNINMEAPGFYVFNAYTTLAGDTIASNDAMPQAMRVSGVSADLPDSIDFNGYNGNNLEILNFGWYEATGYTVPSDSSSLWKSQQGLGDPANISARVNLHATGNNAWIISPRFFVTDSAKLKFDLAVTAKDDISTPAIMGSDDTLSVMLSADCGATWQRIGQFTAADSPGAVFTTKTVDLGAFHESTINIAVKASDGIIDDEEDYDINIDNLILTSPIGDLGIVSMMPAASCNYSNIEVVSVAVKNFGGTSLRLGSVVVNLEVKVTGPVTQTFTRTLEQHDFFPGDILNLAMPGSIDMSLPGIYTFHITANMPGDTDTTNNSLTEIRIVRLSPNLPLQVNFTGFDGDNLESVFPGWNEGTGVNVQPYTQSSWTSNTGLGASGNISAKVRLPGNTSNEWIISPLVIPAPAIELKLKVALTQHGSLTNSATMGADDKVSVMISSDCGASWTSVKDFTVADALTPSLTEFTIYNASYSWKQILIALRATDGLIDDPNDYDFHIDDLDLQAADYPLPVEFLSFSGQRTGNMNLLKWSTASEQNVKGFQVERSADAIHYYPVGFVNSKAPGGNSAVQLDYEFTDNSLSGDKQYYRLRQFDIDGRSQFSNLITITGVNSNKLVLASMYPNPASNILLVGIQAPYRDMIKIVAVNNIGQVVKEKVVVAEKGINTIDFDVHDLAPGTYILKITTQTHSESIAGKFMKQ